MSASGSREPDSANRDFFFNVLAGAVGAALVGGALYAFFMSFGNEARSGSIGVSTLESLVILAASLAGLIILTRGLGLSQPSAALGLPKGSVRALLALSLVVVFVSVASWTMSGFFEPEIKRTELLSKEGADNALQSFQARGMVAWKEGIRGGQRIYYREAGPPEQVFDLAKQILTVVATVLVTVVGFYFGSSSAVDGVNSAKSTMKSMSQALGGDLGKTRNYQLTDIENGAVAVRAVADSVKSELDAAKAKPPGQGEKKEETDRIVAKMEVLERSRSVDADRAESMLQELRAAAGDQAKLNEAGGRIEKFQAAAKADKIEFDALLKQLDIAPIA